MMLFVTNDFDEEMRISPESVLPAGIFTQVCDPAPEERDKRIWMGLRNKSSDQC